jgi:hypothetical protein
MCRGVEIQEQLTDEVVYLRKIMQLIHRALAVALKQVIQTRGA